MSETSMPDEPTDEVDPPFGFDRRHDEQLRFECLKLATSGLVIGEVMKLASELYREVTGRDWPTWKEKPE